MPEKTLQKAKSKRTKFTIQQGFWLITGGSEEKMFFVTMCPETKNIYLEMYSFKTEVTHEGTHMLFNQSEKLGITEIKVVTSEAREHAAIFANEPDGELRLLLLDACKIKGNQCNDTWFRDKILVKVPEVESLITGSKFSLEASLLSLFCEDLKRNLRLMILIKSQEESKFYGFKIKKVLKEKPQK